jgi:iron complex outermembrane receptor protein/outer membrane receptor for ferric coprogen and ferric-rhodotorulic acid
MFVITIAWTPNCRAVAPSSEPVKYNLRIDRQPLGQALQEFARQSGVQIVFFSQVTEGLQAPALNGQFTLAAALEMLLKGSNLTFRVINSTMIEIRPVATGSSLDPAADRSAGVSSAATLRKRTQPRQSTDPDGSGALDEIVVNGTAEGLVATRTETPLHEITQTVAIISQEQMRQENDAEVADMFNNAVGITVVRSNSLGVTFLSRGFQIGTYHLDGGAAINAFS